MEGKRRGGALAALLAVGAFGVAAVPAYGALNGDDSRGPNATQENVPGFVQDEQRPEQRDRDKDCPWKDGNRGGNGGGSGGSQGQEGVSNPGTLY